MFGGRENIRVGIVNILQMRKACALRVEAKKLAYPMQTVLGSVLDIVVKEDADLRRGEHPLPGCERATVIAAQLVLGAGQLLENCGACRTHDTFDAHELVNGT